MSVIIADECLQTARLSAAELLQEVAKMLLFAQQRLTLGQASHLAVWANTAFSISWRARRCREVCQFDWIAVHEVANRSLVAALRLELDPGEAEAIACALETQANRLLLDERLGRVVATRLGIQPIGVLIEAKRQGLLPVVKPQLDALITQAGFWIAKPLYGRVLAAAGEWDAPPV